MPSEHSHDAAPAVRRRPATSASRRARRIRNQAKRGELTQYERERLGRQARAIGCSPAWAEFILEEGKLQGVIARNTHAAADLMLKFDIYPPPADFAHMRACHCNQCQGLRFFPRYYFRRGRYNQLISIECYDRQRTPRERSNWQAGHADETLADAPPATQSAHADVMDTLQRYNLELAEKQYDGTPDQELIDALEARYLFACRRARCPECGTGRAAE